MDSLPDHRLAPADVEFIKKRIHEKFRFLSQFYDAAHAKMKLLPKDKNDFVPEDVETVGGGYKKAFAQQRSLPNLYWKVLAALLSITSDELPSRVTTRPAFLKEEGERPAIATATQATNVSAEAADRTVLAKEGPAPWRLPSRTWDSTIDPPGVLLLAETQVVEFHYRGEEMDKFVNWCNAPDAVGVQTVVGSGGMGKTRFALELCQKMFKENWQGGFIDYTAFDAADETWHHRLDEQKPLLLVFDYAENHGEEVAIVLTRIATHKPKKVRILLLARSAGGPGGWWDQLRMKRIAGDVIKGPATQELVRLKSVAQTLPERVESHRQAQVAFAKRLNKSDYKPQLLTEPNLSQSCFERVLLLHMNALALVEGSEINGAEEILDYVLNRERRYWSEVLSQHQFAETNIGFEEFEQAMVLATFVGGIDKQADLHKAMRSLPCFEKLGPDEVTRKVNALFPLLHDCYGGGKWIDPVQPDLLGQRLFDRAFHGNDYLKKKIFVLVAKLACK